MPHLGLRVRVRNKVRVRVRIRITVRVRVRVRVSAWIVHEVAHLEDMSSGSRVHLSEGYG